MIFRLVLGTAFLIPTVARAQATPSIYAYSGLGAASAASRFERAAAFSARPRHEASAMSGTSGVLIKRIEPPYRFLPMARDLPDSYDLIFFGDEQVAHLRLHVTIGDQTSQQAWMAQLKKYFNYLDRDGDGLLNAFEAEFAFSNRAIQQLLAAGSVFANPFGSGGIANFDRDGDGKISFDEFMAYYQPATTGLLRSQPGVNADARADALTDAMFKLFDRDRDGKLSKLELQDVEKLLPSLDRDEDECLSAVEILPNLVTQPAPANIGPVIPQKAPPASSSAVLQVFKSGTIPDLIVEQLLLRYDKDKNLRLSKRESCFDEATFARLDCNGDGELTIPELMAWKDLPPGLALEMVFSDDSAGCKLRAISGANSKPGPLENMMSHTGDGNAIIRVGRQQIDLGIIAGNGTTAAAPSFNYSNLYQQADPKNKGYFTEQDIVGPQYQYLRILFDVVDRDGDGRVTLQEFTDYFKLQQGFIALPLTLGYLMQTPSFFGLIDVDGDGRLSVPELRDAWNRLRKREPEGGEFITRLALRSQPVVRLVRSSGALTAFGNTSYQAIVKTNDRGPLWFRKMDRNQDGVISRSEFPGRPEDFDKVDLNLDGLISVEEAEAAEKRYRTAQTEKK